MLLKPVCFFGGKGGVGKTTISASVALANAGLGRRTLLVSTDPAHSVSDCLATRIGPEPTGVAEHFDAMEIDPATEADAYIADVKERIAESTAPRLVAEVERQIDVARVSPGAEEAALFDRFTRILQEMGDRYDNIVFDTAPTGHTLRLLSLPELMTAWIAGLIDQRARVNSLGQMWRKAAGAAAGPGGSEDPVLAALEERRDRFVFARNVVSHPDRAAFIFVVTPERLPVLETERAIAVLDKYHIPVGGVVVNRVLPADVPGSFFEGRRRVEAAMLARIETSFPDHALWRVPLFETEVVGAEALARVADCLDVPL